MTRADAAACLRAMVLPVIGLPREMRRLMGQLDDAKRSADAVARQHSRSAMLDDLTESR